MHGSKINSIVSAIKWNLKLQVISVILGGIGDLADKLSGMNMGLATFLTLLLCFDQIAIV